MRIISENIAEYIYLRYDIEEFNDIKELEKIDELVINSLNYSLNIAAFYSGELSYFKNLKDCTFINFEITDDVVENLKNTSINKLTLDNCTWSSTNELDVERIFIELSNINLKKTHTRELTILESGTINIADIINNDLKQLTLLNCNIINSGLLKNLNNCKIKIVGCQLDDETVKELENVKYDPNKYLKIA